MIIAGDFLKRTHSTVINHDPNASNSYGVGTPSPTGQTETVAGNPTPLPFYFHETYGLDFLVMRITNQEVANLGIDALNAVKRVAASTGYLDPTSALLSLLPSPPTAVGGDLLDIYLSDVLIFGGFTAILSPALGQAASGIGALLKP